VVDVRHQDEFKVGHIVDAINIPLDNIENKMKTLEKYKTKPVILVCASGMRSLKAGQLLLKNGFNQVNNLKGGVAAWNQANLPLC